MENAAMSRFRLFLSAMCFAALTAPAWAQNNTPQLVGVNGSWQAFTLDTGNGKVCYAMSVPKSIVPTAVARDPIFFIVSDWPSRSVKGEPEIVPGYSYKEGSTVTAQIGTDKFEFFTQNDTTGGGAWVSARPDEQRLLDAMQRGSQMVVTGISARGTTTRDTYSLVGFTAALASVHKACNM
jgi:hypothetical protein